MLEYAGSLPSAYSAKKMLEPQPFYQSGNFYGSIQNMMCNVLVESNLGILYV
jgi:hypothetical protein